MKGIKSIYHSPVAQALTILAFIGWFLGWQSTTRILQVKGIDDTTSPALVNAFPPINNRTQHQQAIVPVFHVASYAWNEHEVIGEIKHFDWDGIMKSQFLKFETDPRVHHPDLVWVADLVLLSNKVRCFMPVIQRALTVRRQKNQPVQWPIHFLDWSDHPKLLRCPQVEELMGRENVFYHKRSIVTGRHWNTTTKSIDLGHVNTFPDWANFSAAPIQHTPMTVRSDFVTQLHQYVYVNLSTAEGNDLADLDRPYDAVHFWPATGGKVDRGMKGGPNNSQLRDAVSRALLELAQPPHELSTFAGLKGKANSHGRNGVDVNYIRHLVQYKIVVVAQKDNWEDHFRLFEALCSGALVLHDQMLAPPSGLVDGKSIVFYNNVTDLKAKIVYYLKHHEERLVIARRGRQVALKQHRSWHRMEEVVLGRVVSTS
jgi:hypothetical protein